MKPLRVLRIQSRICVGGPALNTILLTAHMNPAQFESRLVGGRLDEGEKPMDAFAEQKGVTITMLPEMGRTISLLDDLKALFKVMRLIRQFKPHVVHTHTAKAGAVGRVAAFLCRVPIRVHTFHGHTFEGYFSKRMSKLVVWTERLLAMISNRIVTISPAQQHDISDRFKVVPAHKTEVIRLGFELDKMRGGTPGKLREELGLDGDARIGAIVARLVPIKHHDLLLRALAHLKRTLPEDAPAIKILVVGDGETRPELEALAKELKIEDMLVFLGWRRDVPDIYADINLNILVSKNEGTPVTLIEGLAVGVPILTTDVGGIRDFADQTCGRIVPADISPEGFADHLKAMLLSDQRRLPDPIRDKIHAGFHVSRLVGDMERLYLKLAEEKGLI